MSNLHKIYFEWIEQPMREYIKTEPQELIDYLTNSTEKLIIRERVVDIQDYQKREEDPTYLKQPAVIEDGILILNDVNDDVINFVKKYTSPNIKSVDLSPAFINDDTFLESFPLLTDVTINNTTTLSPDRIDKIKSNTNIRHITTKSRPVSYNYALRPKEMIVSAGYGQTVLISDDLVIKEKGPSYTESIKVTIDGTNIDFDMVGKGIQELDLDLQKDLKELGFQGKYIKNFTINSKQLEQKEKNFSPLLDIEFNENQDIELLTYNGKEDPTRLAAIVHEIEKTRKIKKIELKCENKTYENLFYLNQIAKKYNLVINYGNNQPCTLEEFVAMRSAIDWYNQIVQEANLSPVEKVLFIYDILKTLKYKENKENLNESRYMHSIVMSDYIVCVGYATFMEQLLKENNIPAIAISVTCNLQKEQPDGHRKNIIRIDDDKYDIHGVYSLDATWDSVRENIMLVEEPDTKQYVKYGLDEGDVVKRKFNSLGLYRNFLVPAEDYKKTYPNDSTPNIIQRTIDNTLDELFQSTDNPFEINIWSGKQTLKDLFTEDEKLDVVQEYMECKKPSLETFKRILYNVRIAEGYTSEEALQSIEEDIELNQMIDDLNRKEPTFFQSSHRR